MLRQAFRVNGASVYVYKRKHLACSVAIDFFIGDLFFIILENRLWAVEPLGAGKCLMFKGSELVKID